MPPRYIVSRLVVMLMMRPQCCLSMTGSAARAIRKAATTLTSMMRRNSAGVTSQNFPYSFTSGARKKLMLTPALLIRISRWPKRSVAARTIFGALSSRVTSATMPIMRSRLPRSSAALSVSSSTGASSSTATTLRAGIEQAERHHPADAAPSPGYDRDFSLKCSGHDVSLNCPAFAGWIASLERVS